MSESRLPDPSGPKWAEHYRLDEGAGGVWLVDIDSLFPTKKSPGEYSRNEKRTYDIVRQAFEENLYISIPEVDYKNALFVVLELVGFGVAKRNKYDLRDRQKFRGYARSELASPRSARQSLTTEFQSTEAKSMAKPPVMKRLMNWALDKLKKRGNGASFAFWKTDQWTLNEKSKYRNRAEFQIYFEFRTLNAARNTVLSQRYYLGPEADDPDVMPYVPLRELLFGKEQQMEYSCPSDMKSECNDLGELAIRALMQLEMNKMNAKKKNKVEEHEIHERVLKRMQGSAEEAFHPQ